MLEVADAWCGGCATKASFGLDDGQPVLDHGWRLRGDIVLCPACSAKEDAVAAWKAGRRQAVVDSAALAAAFLAAWDEANAAPSPVVATRPWWIGP